MNKTIGTALVAGALVFSPNISLAQSYNWNGILPPSHCPCQAMAEHSVERNIATIAQMCSMNSDSVRQRLEMFHNVGVSGYIELCDATSRQAGMTCPAIDQMLSQQGKARGIRLIQRTGGCSGQGPNTSIGGGQLIGPPSGQGPMGPPPVPNGMSNPPLLDPNSPAAPTIPEDPSGQKWYRALGGED